MILKQEERENAPIFVDVHWLALRSFMKTPPILPSLVCKETWTAN